MSPSSRKKAVAAAGPSATRGGAPAQERELRAQGKKTMRKLLDAALVVFEKRGYHAARVDDIVKVARTSHGTFYLYFANKEDLFRALVSDVAEEMAALADDLGPISPDAEGLRDLRAWISRYTDLYDHYGPVIRAWTETETENDEFGRMGTDVTRRFARALILRVEEANVTTGVHPQVAAVGFMAMIERFNYYRASRALPYRREDVIDTLASVVHTGFFGGTRPRVAADPRS